MKTQLTYDVTRYDACGHVSYVARAWNVTHGIIIKTPPLPGYGEARRVLYCKAERLGAELAWWDGEHKVKGNAP